MNVRVRGIYTTALTALVRQHDETLVQASPTIVDRLDTTIPAAPADVTITQTSDRQGIAVTGQPAAVEKVTTMVRDAVGRDTFIWQAQAPQDAIVVGRVDRTKGGGAIVTLPAETEGYLPFDAVDGYIDVGDEIRVQVRTPKPPWSDQAPRLGTTIRVTTPMAIWTRGNDDVRTATDSDKATELLRSMELLDGEVPPGWGLRWQAVGERAGLEHRQTVLERGHAMVDEIETALNEQSPETVPRTVTAPQTTAWIRFGRESRFALDAQRRELTPTMAGHHRIKAEGETASTAVDFLETASQALPTEFPTAAVREQFGPAVGKQIEIKHGKPDGRAYGLGPGTVQEISDDGTVTVQRTMSSQGSYDALGTDREPGDLAITRFVEGRWWYPTVYRGTDGTRKGTYVNICTPLEVFTDRIRYVDLHVDVIRMPDGTVKRVDEAELQAAVEAGQVTHALATQAREVASSVEQALN